MEVATSSALAVLYAAAAEFVSQHYPTAQYIAMHVSLPGDGHHHISLPLSIGKDGLK
jgi:hypothetical protein